MRIFRGIGYLSGVSGIALIFAGIKLPILSLAGIGAVIGGIISYAFDKLIYSTSTVGVVENIPVEEEMKMPDNLQREVQGDPNVTVGFNAAPNITYQYDVLAGQWDIGPVKVTESDIKNDSKKAYHPT